MNNHDTTIDELKERGMTEEDRTDPWDWVHAQPEYYRYLGIAAEYIWRIYRDNPMLIKINTINSYLMSAEQVAFSSVIEGRDPTMIDCLENLNMQDPSSKDPLPF